MPGSKHRLLSSSIWTLAAQVGPALTGLLVIPAIIAGLGNERFGLLTMAWMIIGYFGILDLGIARAITQLVASSDDGPVLREKLGHALALMAIMGAVGAVVVAGAAGAIAVHVFNVPEPLLAEAVRGLQILAIGLPITLLTAAYRAIAEGKLAFAPLTLIRTPLGVANFAAPWLAVRWTSRLDVVMVTLVALRLAGLLLHAALVRRLLGRVPVLLRDLRRHAVELLGYGGWITVSAILSPLMTTFDRFVVGAMLSLNAVAYYVTPYEAVTKMWIVAGAVGSVIFPHFAGARDPAELAKVFSHGLAMIGGVLLVPVLVVLVWADPLIALWISPEFAVQAAPVARILAVAVLANSLALVPYNLVQGQGRPRVTATFHIVELPIYAAALVVGIKTFGITGAAVAYGVRMFLDAALLFAYARRFLRPRASAGISAPATDACVRP